MPGIVTKLDCPSSIRRKLSQETREPVVVTLHVRRQLDKQGPEAVSGSQRLQSVQHDVDEIIALRFEPRAMGDLPMHFWCKEEVWWGRSQPIGHGLLRREAVPHAVQFHGIVAGCVIAKKTGLLERRRIESSLPLPGLVRIARQSDMRLCHRS